MTSKELKAIEVPLMRLGTFLTEALDDFNRTKAALALALIGMGMHSSYLGTDAPDLSGEEAGNE